MDKSTSESIAPKDEKISILTTWLRDAAIILTIISSILYFWGYEYYLGYFRPFTIDFSLFTASPQDYIMSAAKLPLALGILFTTLVLGIIYLFTPQIPLRFSAKISPSINKINPVGRKAIALFFAALAILLTGGLMEDFGASRALSQGNIKQKVVFEPEPKVAIGEQLYFLAYSNGKYLSYFRTDENHKATLVVINSDKVDSILFPGNLMPPTK